ncbi:alanine racemase [Azoarcus sp. KH32C]|uniref:alanine racemase n=1 Tax=Azoarcus sp. KH32C TaxID=748247 RepID=UPI0002385C5E|nr:alanine racemase [Azoarcus sp. KH32C]BAL26886.1 alanine racemase [Azoarcus sp. KH32C]
MSDQHQTRAGALLSIDLDAICDNWRSLKGRLGAAACAAVVKADAYGLGAIQVGPALYGAGCRHFFVAHLNEAIELRPFLPTDAALYVLHGAHPGAEGEFVRHRLVPVLNSLPQLTAWQKLARELDTVLPGVLQVDSGMARLGLSEDELAIVASDHGRLQGIELKFIMSHLVSAEDQANPANMIQLANFRAALQRLPAARASLANSSGIFLGNDFHFNLARPGAALYGVAPVAGQPNPMRPVIRLQGKVLQTRRIETGTAVGYSHTWRAARPSRIATVAVGYADGYLRSLSNRGHAGFEGIRLPIVGNVSMDTITIDVTEVPAGRLGEGSLIDLADPLNGVDEMAGRAGTIGYEILTSLGNRYARRYIGAVDA